MVGIYHDAGFPKETFNKTLTNESRLGINLGNFVSEKTQPQGPCPVVLLADTKLHRITENNRGALRARSFVFDG